MMLKVGIRLSLLYVCLSKILYHQMVYICTNYMNTM